MISSKLASESQNKLNENFRYAICAKDAKVTGGGRLAGWVAAMSRNLPYSDANRAADAQSCLEGADGGPLSSLSVRTHTLRNAEDLREATRGADLNVVQLAPGSFEGRLTHAQIDTLSVSAGDFYPDIRARGVMNPDLVTIGMMVESGGEVMQWDYDVIPGDIVVFPKGVEQEGRFTGHSRYITLTLSEDDLALHSTGERALETHRFWRKIHRLRPTADIRAFICRELAERIAHLRQGYMPGSTAATRYLRSSLIESFIVGILDEQGNDTDNGGRQTGSKLVRAVEDHVDALGSNQLVHISELCSALQVSRRTLHRAFHETLGLGPAEYLRLRRMSAVHAKLLMADEAPTSVTQAALDAGFVDLGRFAAYYRRLYGETPSQTRRRAAGLN